MLLYKSTIIPHDHASQVCPTKKKRIQYISSFFSELGQIFRLKYSSYFIYSSVANLFTTLCPKIYLIHLIQYKLESILSLEIREGSTGMSHMFQYDVWPPSAHRHGARAVDAPDNKRNAYSKILPFISGKILLYAFLSLYTVTITINKLVDGIQRVRK